MGGNVLQEIFPIKLLNGFLNEIAIPKHIATLIDALNMNLNLAQKLIHGGNNWSPEFKVYVFKTIIQIDNMVRYDEKDGDKRMVVEFRVNGTEIAREEKCFPFALSSTLSREDIRGLLQIMYNDALMDIAAKFFATGGLMLHSEKIKEQQGRMIV